MNDEDKLKKLQKFKKDFQKLMVKYPEILMMGDINGDVGGHISLQLPSQKNNHGIIKLTYQGKVIQ
jgi:hypothetical protein